MRWQAPSERTQMILLSPLLIVAVPLLCLMGGAIWLWQKAYELIAPPSEWHPWFAWRPVKHYNDVDWIWLEWAERLWHGHGVGCIYRFAQAGVSRTGGDAKAAPVSEAN